MRIQSRSVCAHQVARIGFDAHSNVHLRNHLWNWLRCAFAFDLILQVDHVGNYPQDISCVLQQAQTREEKDI